METTAAEIMSNEVISVRKGMSVEETLKLLVNSRITGLPVVDPKGKMIGIVSEYDILVQLAQSKKLNPDIFKAPVNFSRKVDSIPDSTPLSKIIALFVKSKYRRLPVTGRGGKLIGIITRRDLMKLFYYRATLG